MTKFMPTWKHGGNWTMSLLSWTAFSKMYQDGRDCNPMFFEFKNGISTYYQTKEALDGIKQAIVKKVKHNPKLTEQKLRNIEKQLKENTQKLKQINSKLKNPGVNLSHLFSQYWELFRKTIFGMAIDIYFDDILGDELAKFLKKDDNFSHYYIILTSPQKFTTTQKEEMAFLKILLRPTKDRIRLFKQHLKKYAYIPMWFDSEPWKVLDLEKRVKFYKTKGEIKKRLNSLQQEISRRKKETQRVIGKLKPPRKIIELINNIQKFAFLRQQGEVQIGYHNFHGLTLKEKISKQLNMQIDDLKFLTDDEIIINLKKKNPLLKEIIHKRQKYCFMIMQDGKYTIYTGSEAKKEVDKIKEQIVEKKPTVSSILKGMVGATGYIKGKVRVLHNLSDINKIKRREIMVVSGTSLEYLTAMQKASAVIAEIGGITSHAAVTCRELKKPCLTRVENATKILRDGDLIEVDANRGLVKKFG